MKEKIPYGETSTKKRKKLVWMYTETSYGEIFMVLSSWFLWKKKICMSRNVPKSIKN